MKKIASPFAKQGFHNANTLVMISATKRLISILVVLLMALIIGGCGGDADPAGAPGDDNASSQKQFVWKAMNYWYYWQGSVANLADDRFSDERAFQEYLKGFADAEAVFNALLFEEDVFSFFIDDYEEFEQSQQGIFSQAFGYEFGLVRVSNSNNIFGYVQYVLPDSPADRAGLERGDLFTKIDGTQLTLENYRDLLLGKDSYQLTLAEIENNTIVETGETVNLQASTLREDPIFVSSVFDTNSTKVGYLVYNAFQTNSHQDLNDVFGNFKTEGIDELVIDLRYNSGGRVVTSQMLAGMISGLDTTNVFARYTYNSKRSDLDRSVPILEEVPIFDEEGNQESALPMNQLALERLYVLTGYGTASASEALINGLDPYMDVVLIGTQTVGKDEGSYTLYDAPEPYLSKENANSDHKNAIQPIVIKVVNKDGRDYPEGFLPDYEVNEVNFLVDGLPPLGDVNDPLLAKALELITGQPIARTAGLKTDSFPGKILLDSRDLQPYRKGLYLQSRKVY